jgi:glycosyltransferase involved in cell wall biosynthesis
MKYQSKLEKEMAMNATLIVTISKYSSEKIQQHYDIDRNKITIVPNGVDTEKFKPTRNFESLKQQFGLTKGLNILFVGNLIPRKGLMFLIEAAKKIILNQTDAKFIIVGEGPQKSELQKNIRDFNLTKSFLFMGNLIERQLLALYDCADLFVLPSIQEGQGIVLLEAQSFGKPVVAFNIGGVNETVQNNKTGFLVDQDKPGALAEGINRLLIDSELRAKMGSNAREFVTENFTWNICAKKMLNVYSELLNKKH